MSDPYRTPAKREPSRLPVLKEEADEAKEYFETFAAGAVVSAFFGAISAAVMIDGKSFTALPFALVLWPLSAVFATLAWRCRATLRAWRDQKRLKGD